MTTPRYRPPHDLGLGGVAISNEFQFATDEQAEAMLAGRPRGASSQAPDRFLGRPADGGRAALASGHTGELRRLIKDTLQKRQDLPWASLQIVDIGLGHRTSDLRPGLMPAPDPLRILGQLAE